MAVTAASGATGNLSDVEVQSYRVLNDGTIALAMCNPDGSSINSILNTTLTSTSANAFTVGPNGTTNPTFNVDGSVTNEATGINVVGAAAGSGVAVTATSSGTNEQLQISPKGSANVLLSSLSGNTGVQIGASASVSTTLLTVKSSNANALTVGPNGSTNPSLQVDASTASAATGLSVKSAAAAGGLAVSVISSGTNENLTVDAKGSGTVVLGGTSTGDVYLGATSLGLHLFKASGAVTVLNTSSQSFSVGPNGTANPVLNIDSSVGSAATGVNIQGKAAGSGVAVTARSSGTNENLTVDAKGSGTIVVGGTSTGFVSLGRGSASTVIASSTIASLGTTQNSTPTAAQLLGGIVTQTSATGAGTVTLPTGTQLSTAVPGIAVGDSFDTVFANLGGAQTLTITGATGSTVLGTAAVGSGKNARMVFVNTGANTWNVYVTVST